MAKVADNIGGEVAFFSLRVASALFKSDKPAYMFGVLLRCFFKDNGLAKEDEGNLLLDARKDDVHSALNSSRCTAKSEEHFDESV